MPRRGAKDWCGLAAKLPETEKWYRNRVSRNRDSGRNLARNLLRLLHEVGNVTPARLLKMTQEELDDYAQEVVDYYQARKLTGSTTAKYLDSLRNFLKWNRIEIKRVPFIQGADESPLAEAQEIPEQPLVGALLDECDMDTAVPVCLQAFSGLRPQVLGKSDGSDGLQLRDLPELKITADGVEFEKVPTRINVRRELSKTRKAYITFLGPQGCDVLANQLRMRLTAGEKLGPSSPVVRPRSGASRFVRRGNLQDSVRIRMRRVGVKASSYVLRSYFDNRIVIAPGVPAIFAEFWMGHKGGMQSRYALQKGLPADVIETMRAAYTKALPFLETRARREEDPVQRIALAALKAAGRSEADLQALDLANMDDGAVVGLLTDALASRVRVPRVPAQSKAKQRVVGIDKLEELLAEGWVFKASLDGGKAIIEQA
jgi:integrase